MKSKFYKILTCLTFLFFMLFSLGICQPSPEMCLTECLNSQDSIPNYLFPGWGQQRTVNLAIVYIDFPDGRWVDQNSIRRQPYTTEELQMVSNRDAAGEVGLTFDSSPFPVGNNLYVNASKYERTNRWNMFFSEGIYYNEAHPDFFTHSALYGDKAYGSMREYWKEVSGDKLIVNPALTHPSASTYELQTGIVNNDTLLPNGKRMIQYITLPLNKYGATLDQAYFPSYYQLTFDPGDPR